VTDFFSENWTVSADGIPIFDDLTYRNKALLRLLNNAEQNFGGEKLGK